MSNPNDRKPLAVSRVVAVVVPWNLEPVACIPDVTLRRGLGGWEIVGVLISCQGSVIYQWNAQRSDRSRSVMKIQILGTGCAKCKKLAENAETAARAMGVDYELEKVTDINEIMGFGVMMTPALVVDGEVKTMGKVPDPEAIKALLG
jgi:small redox-active disulfide protein 2